MKFNSLQNLTLKDGFFDLTELKFKWRTNLQKFEYIIGEQDVMRPDNISNNIYGTTDHLDFLLYFNNIKNPLNIRKGQKILFVDAKHIPEFYLEKENGEQIMDDFLNAAKRNAPDKKRQKFIEEDKNIPLPPTVNDKPSDSVKIENGRIVIE